MNTAYHKKATEIIKKSIKSAIFIDEKAPELFQPLDLNVPEHKLCEDLYNAFKQQGISLTLHKFDKNNPENDTYLFDKRDLVLLDWKLDGETGEEYSLKLLAEAVKRKHIHFCCIYTSESSIDKVLKNILSYFSGFSKEDYENLTLDLDGADIKPILSDLETISLNRNDKNRIKEIKKRLHLSHKDLMKGKDSCKLIQIWAAFSNYYQAEHALPCPEFVDSEKHIVIIENTIIIILKKHYDKDPSNLIDKITETVVALDRNFTHLLGLEMQHLISSKGSFIDKNLIEVSRNTLLNHRKQSEDTFNDLIKNILFEHLKHGLRFDSIDLLNEAILEELSTDLQPPDQTEFLKLNTFYNASQMNKSGPFLNFGDIFFAGKDYYICITALCDCLRPEKIGGLFYFAKGTKMTNKKLALQLGDEAFISFIPNNEIITWTEINSGQDDVEKYKPIYIKPLQVKIINNIIENNELNTYQISKDGQTIVTSKWTYVTTIKQNYAQRIANHAFAHPVRIGVDFAKLK